MLCGSFRLELILLKVTVLTSLFFQDANNIISMYNIRGKLFIVHPDWLPKLQVVFAIHIPVHSQTPHRRFSHHFVVGEVSNEAD